MHSAKHLRISWAFQCVTLSATNCQRNVNVSNTFLSFIWLNVKFMDVYFVCHTDSHCFQSCKWKLEKLIFFIRNISVVVWKLENRFQKKICAQKILSSLRFIWAHHFDRQQIVQYTSTVIVHSPIQRRTEITSATRQENGRRRRQRMNVLATTVCMIHTLPASQIHWNAIKSKMAAFSWASYISSSHERKSTYILTFLMVYKIFSLLFFF